ncbi:hypothetical protein RB195_009910 [Necator americanus]|uniref:Uncharacterized protein n=1 Tax=Necator americanus TaxID=51031 RepID=A0ABR1CVH3_NECAM
MDVIALANVHLQHLHPQVRRVRLEAIARESSHLNLLEDFTSGPAQCVFRALACNISRPKHMTLLARTIQLKKECSIGVCFDDLETDTNIRDYCSITMGTVTVKIAASERDENRIRHGCGHVRRAATMSVLGQR